MDYGKVFRRFRQYLRLSQRDFASLIGISQTSISLLESGKTAPTVETMARLAKMFNISVSTLYILALEVKCLTRKEREAIQYNYRLVQDILWFIACP
ncbi:DNA-binding transcriptional regulator, XRE-family HTH domain [Chitinophaga eiseniae]|uniref:DNA-binding transcriptional regulator, XRE-family HTH domain n=1 Tax=Chitinophaga eiseniae TaxID=634771 RepID=A0A1T4SXE6_9BACT|nr:DNA-binding transcriptional regulator, XRE-family HTH domain [Chitinophaga eiseniae]